MTHGYERGWPVDLAPNVPGGPDGRHFPGFWFTLATEREIFDREMEDVPPRRRAASAARTAGAEAFQD